MQIDRSVPIQRPDGDAARRRPPGVRRQCRARLRQRRQRPVRQGPAVLQRGHPAARVRPREGEIAAQGRRHRPARVDAPDVGGGARHARDRRALQGAGDGVEHRRHAEEDPGGLVLLERPLPQARRLLLPDPVVAGLRVTGGGRPAKDAPYNETHWFDDAWDQRFFKAQGIVDPDERNAAYRELQQPLWDTGGYIIPFVYETLDAAARRSRASSRTSPRGSRTWAGSNSRTTGWRRSSWGRGPRPSAGGRLSRTSPAGGVHRPPDRGRRRGARARLDARVRRDAVLPGTPRTPRWAGARRRRRSSSCERNSGSNVRCSSSTGRGSAPSSAGDLGTSLGSGQPVTDFISGRAGNSLTLAVLALVVLFAVSGVWACRRCAAGRAVDHAISGARWR